MILFLTLRRMAGVALLFILPLAAFAQTDTTWFDTDWQPVASRRDAAFFRPAPARIGDRYHYLDYYYRSRQLQMDGWYRDTREDVKDGPFTYYYENGYPKSRRRYINGLQDSVWTFYYPTGKVSITETWRKGQLNGVRITYYADGGLWRKEVYAADSLIEFRAYDAQGLELEVTPDMLPARREPQKVLAGPDVLGAPERMPEFRGNLNNFLSREISYPKEARKHNKEGRVIVKFVIDEQGKITDVRIFSSSGNEELDAEAVRVIRAMPDWKPGYKDGKPVKVYFTLPITFKLT